MNGSSTPPGAQPEGPSGREAEQRAASPRGQRFVRIVSVVLLGLIGLMTVAGAAGYWMWQGEPEHWEAIQSYFQQADEAELTRMAEDVENRTLRELSQADGSTTRGAASTSGATSGSGSGSGSGDAPELDDIRTLELSYRRINAWLAYRLEPWLENQNAELPEAIARPMVTTHRGDLVLAFRLELPDSQVSQVMSIVFDVEMVEAGRARLVWKRTFAGRLPLPSRWVRQQVIEQVAEQAGGERRPRELAALYEVLDGEPFEARLDIDATRRARLVDLEVGESGVELTLRIEPRPRSSATPGEDASRVP